MKHCILPSLRGFKKPHTAPKRFANMLAKLLGRTRWKFLPTIFAGHVGPFPCRGVSPHVAWSVKHSRLQQYIYIYVHVYLESISMHIYIYIYIDYIYNYIYILYFIYIYILYIYVHTHIYIYMYIIRTDFCVKSRP